MKPREVRRINRPLTPEEEARLQQARAEAESEKPRILALARQWKQAHEDGLQLLREAGRRLRRKREQQNPSLAVLARRTKMTEADLDQLEHDLEEEPTLTILCWYAEALGMKLEMVLTEAPVAQAAGQESG